MNAQVFVLSGPRQGETLTILEPPFFAGNDPGYELYIDPEATPEAAGRVIRIDQHEEGWELTNLGTGEVMVNQDSVRTSCRLRSGDVVRISDAGPEISFSTTSAVAGLVAPAPLDPVTSDSTVAAATGIPVESAGGWQGSWIAGKRGAAMFLAAVVLVIVCLLVFSGKESADFPPISGLDNVTAQEGVALTFKATANGLPEGVSVGYRLDADAPEGMTINEQTGVIGWTPSEQHGGGRFQISVIYDLTKGAASRQRQQGFEVLVLEVDSPPVVFPVPDYVFRAEGDGTVRIQVTAEDPDVPAHKLAYTILEVLDAGEVIEVPEELLFNPQSGGLSWKPTKEQFDKSYTVRVKVEEVSEAALATEKTFQISLPVATVVSKGGVSYLLTMEDEEGLDSYPVGNAVAIRSDVLLTSGVVAAQLQQRKSVGLKIAARRAVSGNSQEIVIQQILVHKLFNELRNDQQKQIFVDFGLLLIEHQDHPVAELASKDEWDMIERGLPLNCLVTAHTPTDPLTRFDDPTAASYPIKVERVIPFPREKDNPLAEVLVLLQATGTLPEGCVGSPVLNKQGHILGIYAERAEIPENHPLAKRFKNRLHYISPGRFVTAWLQRHGLDLWVRPEIPAPATAKEKD